MRRTENKQRRRQNDLTVIERARGPTATPNSEQGEQKHPVNSFFPTAYFFFIFTTASQVRLIMEGLKTTENLPAAC